MSYIKDRYLAIMEELMAEGMSYEEAGEVAYARLPDDLADMVDNLRLKEKEGR